MRKTLLLIVVLLFISAVTVGYLIFGPAVNNPGKKFLFIPSGATILQVKDSIKSNDFLSGFLVFDKVASYAGLTSNIKPGKYKIPNRMSIYHLVKKLREGRQESVNLVITKIRLREDLARKIGKYF